MSAFYYFRSSLLHVIDGACVAHASQSMLAAVRFAASPQRGFFFFFLFLSLCPLSGKWWCRLYPQGALEVGVNALVSSREGSREAGLHVGSRGFVSGRVQDHIHTMSDVQFLLCNLLAHVDNRFMLCCHY